MTLFRLLTEGTRILEQAGSPDAKEDGKQLLLAAFHLDMVHFLMNRMEELEDNSRNRDQIQLYREMIGRRKKRCPLQQILNRQEFMGLEFYVNRHVLIPRQDTEILVELVLREEEVAAQKGKKNLSLLDLCTGSGCIAISLGVKGNFHKITGTDISEEALLVARRNADALLPSKETEKVEMEFFQGDLFGALPKDGRKYHIITSNPPYIPTKVIKTLEPEVRDFEPMTALDGAKDGLFYYRRIASEAGNYLQPDGRMYLEIGHDQKKPVEEILAKAGYENICTYKDLPGRDRVVSARWPKNL